MNKKNFRKHARVSLQKCNKFGDIFIYREVIFFASTVNFFLLLSVSSYAFKVIFWFLL